MAIRPVFCPSFDSTIKRLVTEKFVEFMWSPGMAISQKQKNIAALHNCARTEGIEPILEVSSKSPSHLGVSLSAFNLQLKTDKGLISVESAFQGSKVFESGGPYTDLYGQNGRDIKKDERLKRSGSLKRFIFEGQQWGLEPKTAFYDWLYITALMQNKELSHKILPMKGFTDIEFNPQKSINCQARSCACFVTLNKYGLLEKAMSDPAFFRHLLADDAFFQSHSSRKRQGEFDL